MYFESLSALEENACLYLLFHFKTSTNYAHHLVTLSNSSSTRNIFRVQRKLLKRKVKLLCNFTAITSTFSRSTNKCANFLLTIAKTVHAVTRNSSNTNNTAGTPTYNNISGQQQTAILSYQTCKSHTRSTFSALWQLLLLLLPTAATRSAINFISKVALFGYLSRAAVRYYIQHTVRSPDWPINLATRKVQSAAVRRMIYGRLSLRGLVLVLFQQLN